MSEHVLSPREDGSPPDRVGARIPVPMFTRREAVRAGVCTRQVYDETLPFYEYTVRHHLLARTPRPTWEPPEIVGHKLSAPYVADASDLLARRLARDVDPLLDRIDARCGEVAGTISRIEQLPEDIRTIESRTTYGGVGAVRRHGRLTDQIENDLSAGFHHHDRAPRWLKALGRLAPWTESLGFLAFLMYYLNVPILAPWEDWMGWSFALILVVYIILGQTSLVERAAVAHNHSREESAKGNRHLAEASRRRRSVFAGSAAFIALVITSGIVLRGLVALGDTDPAVTAVMIALAATTGLLMPVLSFLGRALDGSKVSRERDGLAADLGADRAFHDELTDHCAATLDDAQALHDRVTHTVVPGILGEVQQRTDAARIAYSFLRIQIGGLTAEPAAPGTAAEIAAGSHGQAQGWITNGVPGSERVNLQVLLDRASRLENLRRRRQDLERRLSQLPRHPWDPI